MLAQGKRPGESSTGGGSKKGRPSPLEGSKPAGGRSVMIFTSFRVSIVGVEI
jgi:hypothetical protein